MTSRNLRHCAGKEPRPLERAASSAPARNQPGRRQLKRANHGADLRLEHIADGRRAQIGGCAGLGRRRRGCCCCVEAPSAGGGRADDWTVKTVIAHNSALGASRAALARNWDAHQRCGP
jgi:hypothetical protein